MAYKLKTSNIMSIINKVDRSIIISWQETADEIMKVLFLKDNEIVRAINSMGNKLPTNEIECYIVRRNKRIHKNKKTKESSGSRQNQG